ncbi:hypothetical protein AA313_de0209359 [Arthrobotrys entomopaga]|nr:hypothetical protein AA313_de0209359 [Arthrobotrys entomopaga]
MEENPTLVLTGFQPQPQPSTRLLCSFVCSTDAGSFSCAYMETQPSRRLQLVNVGQAVFLKKKNCFILASLHTLEPKRKRDHSGLSATFSCLLESGYLSGGWIMTPLIERK